MSQNLILLPVLAHVALIFAILVVMALRRQASIKAQRKSVQDMATATERDWEPAAAAAAACFRNQFEMPVLFFVVCVLALDMRSIDFGFLVLAWLFVISRVVQVHAHLTHNRIAIRGGSYLAGCAVLMVMWLWLSVTVLSRGF